MSLQQFTICQIDQELVVVLTNTLFHDIDAILVAMIKPRLPSAQLSHFHIPIEIDQHDYVIDVLELATVSKFRLKPRRQQASHCAAAIKSAIDLLIDGF